MAGAVDWMEDVGGRPVPTAPLDVPTAHLPVPSSLAVPATAAQRWPRAPLPWGLDKKLASILIIRLFLEYPRGG
jgi:hypothetical protein